jgi:HAD superfamily hydrolase (TIGR01509 family)
MPAILFGSISTIADTSELQRQSFNEAFAEHGLDWEWDQPAYQEQLASNGGQQRVADFAEAQGEVVDAQAVHQTKSKNFQQHAADLALAARPGVLETIRDAKEAGYKVGLVTTTSAENVEALLGAVTELGREDFDLVVDGTQVEAGKPDAAAYTHALEALELDAGETVAIEDNVGGVQSAQAAGVKVVAFPNENTGGHDFGAADDRTDALSFDALAAHVA